MAKIIDLVSNCPNCNRKHSESNKSKVALIKEKGKFSTIHITCGHCGIGVLALVSKGPMGVISLGMMTDLTEKESKPFISAEPISADEVIAVHKSLKSHKSHDEPKHPESGKKR
jgi:transcription elongation factor Elf1